MSTRSVQKRTGPREAAVCIPLLSRHTHLLWLSVLASISAAGRLKRLFTIIDTHIRMFRCNKNGEAAVLFQLRSSNVKTHKGQVGYAAPC